jgi:hypothetical protein
VTWLEQHAVTITLLTSMGVADFSGGIGPQRIETMDTGISILVLFVARLVGQGAVAAPTQLRAVTATKSEIALAWQPGILPAPRKLWTWRSMRRGTVHRRRRRTRRGLLQEAGRQVLSECGSDLGCANDGGNSMGFVRDVRGIWPHALL